MKDTKKEEKEQDESTQGPQPYSYSRLGTMMDKSEHDITQLTHAMIYKAISDYARLRLREDSDLTEAAILEGVERILTYWYTTAATESLVREAYSYYKGH